MSTVTLPAAIPQGNSADPTPSKREPREVFVQHRSRSQYCIVTNEMISESHQSHYRATFRDRLADVETKYKLVISPNVRIPNRWHEFGYVGDVRPSTGTSNLPIWTIFLRRYPREINLSFISLSYAENSTSVGAFEGSEDDTIAVASPRKAPEVSPLAQMIRAVHQRTPLDEESVEDARRAVADACAFADREMPEEKPLVMVSDDGLVMLQWRNEDSGVLLIFTGDGTANYSIKLPGHSYSSSSVEFSLADRLPAQIKSAIGRIAST